MMAKKQLKGMAVLVVMVCIAALTAFAGVALAHEGGWGEHGRVQHHDFRKIAKKLKLTDAQKAQAKAIFKANKDVVKPMFANLRAERKTLEALIHSDNVDEAAIRGETAKLSEIQADLNVNRARMAAQFRAILTPDQLAELKALQTRHKRH